MGDNTPGLQQYRVMTTHEDGALMAGQFEAASKDAVRVLVEQRTAHHGEIVLFDCWPVTIHPKPAR